MDFKAAHKCFIEQGSGLVIDAASNRLPTKSVLLYRITSFIITKDRDIDNFAGGKLDAIYQADDEYFNLSTYHYHAPNMSLIPQYYHHHRQHDRQGQQRYNHYDQ